MNISSVSTSPNQENCVDVSRTFSADGIQNLVSHRALLRPQSVRLYTKRMSMSPLCTCNNDVRLRTALLVMYCLFHNFYILFLIMLNYNLFTGMRYFLVNHGNLPFTNSLHPSLHSLLMYFVHIQNSMLYPSYQPQNEAFPTRTRASTPTAR